MILKKQGIGLAMAGLLVGGIIGGGAVSLLRSQPDFSMRYTEASSAFDVSNDRVLAGWADNVFSGKVTAKLGQETVSETSDYPLTLWSVEVISNIKGNLTGTVTVAQQGGYLKDSNTLMLMEDDTLLAPGQEYLFVSRSRQGKHWLVPVYGDTPLPEASFQENKNVHNRWETAVKNQLKDAWKEGFRYTPPRD